MKIPVIGAAVLLSLCVPALSAAQQQDVVGQAVTITLSNGSKISGTVTMREGGTVTLDADLIGEIMIDEQDIAAFGPAATAAPPQAAPSQTVAPAVTWTTTGTVGYTFLSAVAPGLGVGDTHGTNLSLSTERASPTDAVSLSSSYTYQRTKPAGAAANNGSLALAYNRPFKQVYTFISRTTFAKDSVQKVNYRLTNLNGIGFIPIFNSRVSLSVVPGVGFTALDYTIAPGLEPLFADVKDKAVGYGIYNYLKVNLVPTLSFQQTLLHLRSFTTRSQHTSQAEFALVGLVSPTIGLTISLKMNYDSQLPEPTFKKLTSTLTSGVQFKF